MISIKFKDNIIKEYSIDKLSEIPFFKSLFESCNKINEHILFDNFNSDIIDHLIHNYRNINFYKYDFDDLFQAKEFLRLYELDELNKSISNDAIEHSIQYQFITDLKFRLISNRINLKYLKQYLFYEHELFLSDIIRKYPRLTHLYPYVEYLEYRAGAYNTDPYHTDVTDLDLTKFTNLIALKILDNKIKTFNSYGNLKNLKVLFCAGCNHLKDGCFDIFENLETLVCVLCHKLKTFPNLLNLKTLVCIGCYSLKDGCFDALINLEVLNCSANYDLKRPFNANLKNLKKLNCNYCYNLEDECFDVFMNLEELYCGGCKKLKNPFNENLETLKILNCLYCSNLENGCFDTLKNLEILESPWSGKLNRPFDRNYLRNYKKRYLIRRSDAYPFNAYPSEIFKPNNVKENGWFDTYDLSSITFACLGNANLDFFN